MYASRLASRLSLTAHAALAVALTAVPAPGCDVLFPEEDTTIPVPSSDTSAVLLDAGPDGHMEACGVLSIDPPDGQTIASNSVTVTVRFTAPLASPADGTAPPVTLARLGADGSVAETLAPNTSWRADGDRGVLFLTPVGWLDWDTEYLVTVGADTQCANGATVGTTVESRFRTPPQGGSQPTGGVFYACQDGGGRVSLRRVGLDGAGDAEVADLGAAFVGVSSGVAAGTVVRGMPSPDGKRVVWAILGSDQFTSALVGYDVDAGAAYGVSADAVVSGEDVGAQVFDISAQGEVALLGPLANGQRDQITVVGLDGAGARTVLGPSTVLDSLAGVAWRADGQRLVVLAAGGAHPGLYEVDATTGAETLVKDLNQPASLGLPGHMASDAASGHAARSRPQDSAPPTDNTCSPETTRTPRAHYDG